MAVIIKRSDDGAIALPARLMTALNVSEGDEVKAIVDGQSLRLVRLDTFLALRGALADDESLDRASDQTRFWSSFAAWQDDRPVEATLHDIHQARQSRAEPPAL